MTTINASQMALQRTVLNASVFLSVKNSQIGYAKTMEPDIRAETMNAKRKSIAPRIGCGSMLFVFAHSIKFCAAVAKRKT